MGLKIENLCVDLQKNQILKHIELDIESGAFVSLLGPSGCGKSTLLKSIAGLLDISSGEIRVDEESITRMAPEKRGTVIVFQDLCLFPHMTVEQNVAFSMQLKNIPKQQQEKRVRELLELVQLQGFEKRRIKQMSGGQKQRVALARAIAANPRVLLLDEPFSGLDENLRDEMGYLVKRLHQQMGCITIMVTHDKREAMRFSDKIALMLNGNILQYDSPQTIFYHPATRSVAEYIGQGNYLAGTVKDGQFYANGIQCPTDKVDGEYDLLVHPHAIRFLNKGGSPYRITDILFEGEIVEVHLQDEKSKLIANLLHDEWNEIEAAKGSIVGVTIEEQNRIFFEKEE